MFWTLSLFLPARQDGTEVWPGWGLLIFGLYPLITLQSFGWLANPLLALSLASSSWRASLGFALAALLVGLTTLVNPYINYGTSGPGEQTLLVGYYMWIGSMVCALWGAINRRLATETG